MPEIAFAAFVFLFPIIATGLLTTTASKKKTIIQAAIYAAIYIIVVIAGVIYFNVGASAPVKGVT